eukprot:TRINITY_DN3767_c0_g1_i5.p1 TRINITY_DN3767_c0_g1~~TRINITY_DN3767_c0_g1_i5.p1  ORF type:complete len:378 (+),score=84.55 TRINITY_DN3767_c0_g1_i5:126-1259(+)
MAGDGGQRPPANRMTLQTFKGRLGGAKKGHSLLKKKRDALKSRFQMILKDIVDTKLKVGQSLKDASFALAKSHWANTGSDICSQVIERAGKPSVTCKLAADNIAGVSIPVFKMLHDPAADAASQTLALGHGGAVVNATRLEYQKAVASLVKLASLQTMFKTLDMEIKMTSRRVNALEYVLIPRLAEVLHYVTQEMDEEAREEFFRVKKVVEKKKQKVAAEKAAELAEHAEEFFRVKKVVEKKKQKVAAEKAAELAEHAEETRLSLVQGPRTWPSTKTQRPLLLGLVTASQPHPPRRPRSLHRSASRQVRRIQRTRMTRKHKWLRKALAAVGASGARTSGAEWQRPNRLQRRLLLACLTLWQLWLGRMRISCSNESVG